MAMQTHVQNITKPTARRDVLGVLTAVAASVAASAILPRAAIAAEPDPIFPAIAAWREADNHHSQLCYDETSNDDARDISCIAYHDAARRMAEIEPTTLAGLAALAEYTMKDMSTGEVPWQAVALASVARSLRRMAGGTPVVDIDEALEDHLEEHEQRPGLLEYFGATAPAPHITLPPHEEPEGWCIKAEADGFEPYIFGGYADSEKTAVWAAHQVAEDMGAKVRERGAQ